MSSPIIPVLAGRRRRNPALAGVARCPAEAIPAAGRRALDLSGNLAARAGIAMFAPPIVITGAEFPLLRAPPGRGNRHRRHRRDRADAAQFRPGDRGGGGARQRAAIRMPWCWRSPPTTSSSMSRNSAPPASPALHAAEAGRIVTFGITPSAPKTSYGYILPRRSRSADDGVYAVEALRRKARYRDRRPLCREGYLWNSGNFLFRADVLLAELARLEPDDGGGGRSRGRQRQHRSRFRAARAGSFARAPQKSIDYAVMEKTDRAAVVAGNFRWSDIGSWDAIFDIRRRDNVRQRRSRHRRDDGRAATA